MKRTEQVLIVSSSQDYPTWGPIATSLEERGHDVVVFEADKVALGTVDFETTITTLDGLQLRYNGLDICPDTVGAAWYRRTSFLSDTAADAAKQLGIDTERKALQQSIWNTIPDKKWLNSPEAMLRANRKLGQLCLAREVGFEIPDTVVSNSWDTIKNTLPNSIIYKSSYPLLYGTDEVFSLFTTPYQNSPEELPTTSNPFPGIWQPQLQKAREWRITAVDDMTFDAAIYTSPTAKDDWRKHQNHHGQVEFRHESFDHSLREKCLTYLSAAGLRFGAFDFVEDSEGKVTFLECNPNGQFRWIEDALDLPISSSIVNVLAKTALKN